MAPLGRPLFVERGLRYVRKARSAFAGVYKAGVFLGGKKAKKLLVALVLPFVIENLPL